MKSVHSWQKIVNKDLTQQEKYSLLMMEAEKMEELAHRKEIMAKVDKNTLDEDADDLYINSIKAKLAILE